MRTFWPKTELRISQNPNLLFWVIKGLNSEQKERQPQDSFTLSHAPGMLPRTQAGSAPTLMRAGTCPHLATSQTPPPSDVDSEKISSCGLNHP